MDFTLKNTGVYGSSLHSLGIYKWSDLLAFIRQLPYGRTQNRADFSLVLTEKKGTCSSKHALVRFIAKEEGVQDLRLVIGIYKMNAENTPGIGDHLKRAKLPYLPEAHTYLYWKDELIDLTFPASQALLFPKSLMMEYDIEPEQAGNYKESLHRAFLAQWIEKESIPYSLKELWKLREACIYSLST